MVRGGRIAIARTRCLSCAACPPVCHSGALVLHALYLEIDEKLCDNCLLCVTVCPVGAITKDTGEYKPDSREYPDRS